MTPETRAALAAFETDLAGEAFVSGLYRILARWPGFLAHLAATLGPLLRDPAALDACEEIATGLPPRSRPFWRRSKRRRSPRR